MQLEFKQGIIAKHLFKELAFQNFLNLFDQKQEIIPHQILSPLTANEAITHYTELDKLAKSQLRISNILETSIHLPCLDFVLQAIDSKTIEQFHCFQIGKFISIEKKIIPLEKEFPLDSSIQVITQIENILQQWMNRDNSAFQFDLDEQGMQMEIQTLEANLSSALNLYEQKIFDETGIRMIYPYPKELEHTQLIADSIHLKITRQKNGLFLDYKLPENIQLLLSKKKALFDKLNGHLLKRLQKINEEFFQLYQSFSIYYQERKKRILHYILIDTANKHNLIFPVIEKKNGLTGKALVLSSLQEQDSKRYAPLDISLKKGANLLFGANMTGKTTTLKTIYFHLILIQMGLPTPCKEIRLNFPAQIELLLKTSGDTKKNLSTFSEEINFFCKDFAKDSFVLVDELFQSTNPISGTKLSQIFLEEMGKEELVFFCNSHYQEVIKSSNINLLKMEEPILTTGKKNQESLNELLREMPYSVKNVSIDDVDKLIEESNNALTVALHFPLKERIKEKIRKKIRD